MLRFLLFLSLILPSLSFADGGVGGCLLAAGDSSAADTGVSDPRTVLLHGLDTCSFLVVDKQLLTLSLVDSGGLVARTWPVACAMNYGAKVRKGDHRTPEGVFPISQLLNSSDLTHDFRDGKGKIPGAYGPWFLRLDVPGFIDIGIHGTHLPESVGSRATEGCIRMRNSDILELKELVHLGMPVVIMPDSAPDVELPLPDTLATDIFERYSFSPRRDLPAPDSAMLAEVASGVQEAAGDAPAPASVRSSYILLWIVPALGIGLAALIVFGFFSLKRKK